jgi:hypothetical protein
MSTLPFSTTLVVWCSLLVSMVCRPMEASRRDYEVSKLWTAWLHSCPRRSLPAPAVEEVKGMAKTWSRKGRQETMKWSWSEVKSSSNFWRPRYWQLMQLMPHALPALRSKPRCCTRSSICLKSELNQWLAREPRESRQIEAWKAWRTSHGRKV